MEQDSKSMPKLAAVDTDARDFLQERRSRIVLEQEREVVGRYDARLRVSFRRSEEEDRLVTLLAKQSE